MKVHLTFLLEKVKSNFWLIPGIIALTILGCLFVLLSVPQLPETPLLRKLFVPNISRDLAMTLLGSIATSLMTVVGVLFSIMIVVLQQASQQYSPRVMQYFIRSTPTQLVLGSFIGSFIYVILLLSNLREDDLPNAAISFSILLALLCISLLIFFIYHVMQNLQSTKIIANITEEGIEAIENMYKDRSVDDGSSPPDKNDLPYKLPICSSRRGYLQEIGWEKIHKRMGKAPWLAEYHFFPGSHIQKGQCLVTVHLQTPPTEKLEKFLQRCVSIGEIRTNAQDPTFVVQKLVDIALRGLSPGVNDPTTALEALNGIETILLLMIERTPRNSIAMNSGYIEMLEFSPEHFVGLCFDQIITFSEKHWPLLKELERKLVLAQGKAKDVAMFEALGKRLSTLNQIHPMAPHLPGESAYGRPSVQHRAQDW